MPYRHLGYNSWGERLLNDPGWIVAKKKVRRKYGQHCRLCDKYLHYPDNHHISYKRVGWKDEWKDVRPLCRACHRAANFFLWVFKITSDPWLRLRYYELRLHWMMIKTRNWVISSYGVDDPRSRKRPR